MSGSMNVCAPGVCGLNTNSYIMNERFTLGIKISSWPLLHHRLTSGTRTSWARPFLSSTFSPAATKFGILDLVRMDGKTDWDAFVIKWNTCLHNYGRFIVSRVIPLLSPTLYGWRCHEQREWGDDGMIRGDLNVVLHSLLRVNKQTQAPG